VERENSNGTENSKVIEDSKGRGDSQGVGDSRGMMDLRVEGDENRKRCADVVREILGKCEGTVVSLDAQIALYVGVACIAREKHGCTGEKDCTGKKDSTKTRERA
jgi:hypothetical protein